MIAACCYALCGAAAASFKGVDITGQGYGGEFRLSSHDGKPRALSDFRGKVIVLAFGFTRCPDVCPTTLATLAAVMDALGEDRKQVQVLLVTVDPERDTPKLLGNYVTAFEPTFIGLSGGAKATRDAARAFRVFYQKVPASADGKSGGVSGGYTMDHSTGYYVLDKQGRTRLMFRYEQPLADMVQDLRALLRE